MDKKQPHYDFKVDLPDGEEAERTVAFLLHLEDGDLIEVKRDFEVTKTGNVAIEYECRGKKSGIATTKAAWWAIYLNGEYYSGEAIILIKTDRLKGICRKYLKTKRDIAMGDNKTAKGIIIPVKELLS